MQSPLDDIKNIDIATEAPDLNLRSLADYSRAKVEALLSGLSDKLKKQITAYLDSLNDHIEGAEEYRKTILGICDNISIIINNIFSRNGFLEDIDEGLAEMAALLDSKEIANLDIIKDSFDQMRKKIATLVARFISAVESEDTAYITDINGYENFSADMQKLFNFISGLKRLINLIQTDNYEAIQKRVLGKMTETIKEPIARYMIQGELFNELKGDIVNQKKALKIFLSIIRHQIQLLCEAIAGLGLVKYKLIAMPQISKLYKLLIVLGNFELALLGFESLMRSEDILDKLKKTKE